MSSPPPNPSVPAAVTLPFIVFVCPLCGMQQPGGEVGSEAHISIPEGPCPNAGKVWARKAIECVAAAYAIDSRSSGDGLHLSREEIEAAIAEVIGEPRSNIEHGRACDRFLREGRRFLADTEGEGDRG